MLIKFIAAIALCLLPSAINSQIHLEFQLINDETKQPVEGIYCYILENNDKWIAIGSTDKNGLYIPNIKKYNRRSNYQVCVTDRKFKPAIHEVNLLDKNRQPIVMYPDSTFAEKQAGLTYKECSSISFGFYFPKEPTSMNDLPDSIRIKLASHLVDRLGEEFYSTLQVSGGQIVDLERLYKVENNARNYQWIPYSYYLCFSFQDWEKGIGLYTAKIALDKYGNVMEEIELPKINGHPEKAKIVSKEDAIAIAKASNFYSERTDVSFSYHEKSGSFIWLFENYTLHENHQLSGKCCIIDAHDGSIINSYNNAGMWR